MNSSPVTVYPLYGALSAVGLTSLTPVEGAVRTNWPEEQFDYGHLAPGVECLQPSAGEWRYLQPSETTNQDIVWDPYLHVPPPCLSVTSPPAVSSGNDPRGREGVQARIHGCGTDAIRALRLLKAGWFLDPALSEHVSEEFPRSGQLSRHMGAYRLAFHDEDANPLRAIPFDQYAVDPADFGHAAGDAKPLQVLYDRLRQHRESPVSSTEIALAAFNRSFGFQLSMEQRFVLLATSLDALFGGMSATRISKTKMALPFRERVRAALAASGAGDAEEEANWLDTDVRAIRNAVAHGRALELGDPAAELTRLQRFLRITIVQHLEFSLQWRMPGADFREAFGASLESCAAAYNLCLVQAARNETGAAAARWLGAAKN